MYTAVIIDDEPWSLIEIQKTFPFNEFNFTVIGAYQNSVLAVEKILATPPDLVITDIRMPQLDGLKLIDRLREHSIKCEVVISSGFNDFEYAKRAIQQGVCDYCLKPTEPAEARNILSKLKQKFDNQMSSAFTSPSEQEKQLSNFDKMIEYIDANFHTRMTLGELAVKYSINSNYCCELFMKNKGVTFSQYITRIRIEKAKELMGKSEYTLDKISGMVGFSDSFYFSKVFKKHCGISPSQYRRKRGMTF